MPFVYKNRSKAVTLSDLPQGNRTSINSLWLLTDGKAGDLAHVLGIAEALGLEGEMRTVSPKKPFVWMMPYGGIDPSEDFNQPNSPIAPPFPDLVIATGRRTVPYVRRIRQLSPSTFTVLLKDPRTGPEAADFIWVPEHDKIRAENVLVTLTSPHRFGTRKLEKARETANQILPVLASPRILVSLGGNSRHHTWSSKNIHCFANKLKKMSASGASFMVTPSRRTPERLSKAVKDALEGVPHYFWDGTGENPYIHMLATADHIVVTSDSVNMVGEALTTGKPVYLCEPDGGHKKFEFYLNQLKKRKAILPFTGELDVARYAPIDSTAIIATEIRRRFALWRARHRKLVQMKNTP